MGKSREGLLRAASPQIVHYVTVAEVGRVGASTGAPSRGLVELFEDERLSGMFAKMRRQLEAVWFRQEAKVTVIVVS